MTIFKPKTYFAYHFSLLLIKIQFYLIQLIQKDNLDLSNCNSKYKKIILTDIADWRQGIYQNPAIIQPVIQQRPEITTP
jgi:hypothetical protein